MSDYVWKLTQEELHHKQNFSWEQGILYEQARILSLLQNYAENETWSWNDLLRKIKGENE